MEILPQEVLNHIKDYVIFKPKTKEELQEAVDFYCENKEQGIQNYGYINNWDTSLIADMSFLFQDQTNFNDLLYDYDEYP